MHQDACLLSRINFFYWVNDHKFKDRFTEDSNIIPLVSAINFSIAGPTHTQSIQFLILYRVL